MNTLTNERLEEIASSAVSSERISMANELLSLRAQLAELRGQEPIGAFHITDGEFEATSDYCARGEFPIQDGLLEVYARPAPQAVIQPVLSDVIEKFSEMNIGFPVQKLKADYVISWVLNNYPCDIKSQPYTVPDGWELVPIEPTEAMLILLGMTGSFDSMIVQYQKAIAAAPQYKGV